MRNKLFFASIVLIGSQIGTSSAYANEYKLNNFCKNIYSQYLQKQTPKAFLTGSDGSCWWWHGEATAFQSIKIAFDYCRKRTKGARCTLREYFPNDPSQQIPDDIDLSTQEVKRLQTALTRLNYRVGTIDGKLGPKARSAAKRFAKQSGRNNQAGSLRSLMFAAEKKAGTLATQSGEATPIQKKRSSKVQEAGLLSGNWRGTYQCRQGKTGVTLTFGKFGLGTTRAKFEFYPASGGPNVPSGSFLMDLRFDRKRKKLSLSPYKWIKRPSGYAMIRVQGKFSPSGDQFDGRIRGSGCSAINLTRGGQQASKDATVAQNTKPETSNKGTSSQKKQLNPEHIQTGSHPVQKISPRDRAKTTRSGKKLVHLSSFRAYFYAGIGGTLDFAIDKGICKPTTPVKIIAKKSAALTNQQLGFIAEFPDILPVLQRWCPHARAFELRGFTRREEILVAKSEMSDGWQLKISKDLLSIYKKKIDDYPKKVESIGSITRFVKRQLKYLGGSETDDGRSLKAYAEAKKQALRDHQIAQYEHKLKTFGTSTEGVKKLRQYADRTARQVKRLDPAAAQTFQTKIDEALDMLAWKIFALLQAKTDPEVVSWKTAFKANEMITQYKTDFPDRSKSRQSELATMRADLASLVEKSSYVFEEDLKAFKTDWQNYDKMGRMVSEYQSQANKFAGYKAYADLAIQYQQQVAERLANDATTSISSYGNSIDDIDALVGLSERLKGPFYSHGLGDLSSRLDQTLLARIDQLIDDGFEPYSTEIAVLEADRPSLLQLKQIQSEFGALSEAMPGFEQYVKAAQQKAENIEQELCNSVIVASGADTYDETLHIGTGNNQLSLKDFACQASRAGYKITYSEKGWFSKSPSHFTAERKDNAGLEIALSLVEVNGQEVLAGDKETQNDVSTEMDAAMWNAKFANLTRPLPTGIPDAKGRTECDFLASDPGDKNAVSQGVSIEQLELEPAIDACIASIEFDAENARSNYLLARLLDIAGYQEQSGIYLQIAVDAGYPAALNMMADQALLDEEGGIEKAYRLLAKAAETGNENAIQKLNELTTSGMVDLTKITPTAGIFNLSCFTEQYSRNGHREIDFSMADELLVKIDFTRQVMKFDYKQILTYSGKPLINANKDYKMVEKRGGAWRIVPNMLGPVTREDLGDLKIDQKTLKIQHGQTHPIQLPFGKSFRHRGIYLKGECMQSVN